jgi:hypothetical protein
MVLPTFILTPTLLLLLVPSQLSAENVCKQPALMHQHRDVATVLQLEDAWNTAYIRGDTDFERCLLAPSFTEILRTGDLLDLAGELELAEKNRGKNPAIPEMPQITVLLHGNLAVAYGKSSATDSDGKPQIKFYSDSYTSLRMRLPTSTTAASVSSSVSERAHDFEQLSSCARD